MHRRKSSTGSLVSFKSTPPIFTAQTRSSRGFQRLRSSFNRTLVGTLEELRDRMTPGRVVDQVVDYTRDSPAAEFLRNLGREVRVNPMPLVLIGIGIAWLM